MAPGLDGMARRFARRVRSFVTNRLLNLAPLYEGVAELRRETAALLSHGQEMTQRMEAFSRQLEEAKSRLDDAKLLTARSVIAQLSEKRTLADAEFRVFSQWGEDGIIQYLLRRVEAAPPIFVEFGVEDYQEANTRFLLVNNNWRGLVFDSSAEHIAAIQRDSIYWKHDLAAVCAFVDPENINDLLTSQGISGEIGLLSIDIDGIDYWVWKAITTVEPVIVIVEYNSVFGSTHAVSVPYDPRFFRTNAHASNLYFGASLRALVELGKAKGYAFVGCNSAGNDAFFVRRDRLGDVPEVSLDDGYVQSRFRESRDQAGRLTYLSGVERLQAIRDMPLVNVATGQLMQVGDLGAEFIVQTELQSNVRR